MVAGSSTPAKQGRRDATTRSNTAEAAAEKEHAEKKSYLSAQVMAAQAEAKRSEQAVVVAIEEAIHAKILSEANRATLEKARKDVDDAQQEVEHNDQVADRLQAESEEAAKAVEAFKGTVPKARKAREAAEARAVNAVEEASKAAEAVALAEFELKKAQVRCLPLSPSPTLFLSLSLSRSLALYLSLALSLSLLPRRPLTPTRAAPY